MIFKRLDANGDGRVSKAEFEVLTQKLAERGQGKAGGAMGGRLFDRLDVNGDGSLSATEFARLQELRARMQGGNARPGLPKGARGIR
jgi:Ca2+-binding EF-hand superfamily protein